MDKQELLRIIDQAADEDSIMLDNVLKERMRSLEKEDAEDVDTSNYM